VTLVVVEPLLAEVLPPTACLRLRSLQSCFDDAEEGSRALFLELLACILPWCGGPDACAYSGETPGCDLDRGSGGERGHRDARDGPDDRYHRDVAVTEAAFEDELEAFGEAVEAVALDGCGGSAIRVRSVERPAGVTLALGDGVDEAVFAEHLVPEISSRFQVGEAAAQPDWEIGIERISSTRFEAECLPSIHRTVAETRGLPLEAVAFARDHVTPGLVAIASGAPTFLVLSNHAMTCCGSGMYVVERPSRWLVIQLYAFC
jgi:hypothetical protein